jgi:hypothetical protein
MNPINLLDDWYAPVLAPWEEQPYRLISWLDMLTFSAEAFFWCGSALRAIRADCLAAAAICVNGEPGFALVQPLDGAARNKALTSLPKIEAWFRKLALNITAETIHELSEKLKESPQKRDNFQWLMDQIEHIEKLARKELNNRLFFYVPPERARFWPLTSQPNPFGSEVGSKFPSATFDIQSAAICLATAMSTASVFHLMRVLEIGLAALGKVFGVSLAHTNWEPAIREIEAKIRDMHKDPAWKTLSDCKEQQEFYSQAASAFAVVKDAWRNYTMHVRGKYLESEAELIFENVKAFMQKLAQKIVE